MYMKPPTKTVLSISGGMDSCTLLVHLLEAGRVVQPVNFRYDSKHNVFERMMTGSFLAAMKKRYPETLLPIIEVDVSGVFEHFKSDLLISGGEIPEGHYEDESMSRTVVPGRNSIFATICLGVAQSIGANEIALGVHAGDHHIYPDCRREYIAALASTVDFASEGKIKVVAPFQDMNKADILRIGKKYSVPYHLTRTCYKHQELSCGKCGSCRERLEAFEEIGVQDPIWYETDAIVAQDCSLEEMQSQSKITLKAKHPRTGVWFNCYPVLFGEASGYRVHHEPIK